MMPRKPTRTLTTGWLDKKGDVGGGWKTRYFVLLSSRELLYFESETSSKRKGTIDLKEVSALQAPPPPPPPCRHRRGVSTRQCL